MDSIDLDLTNNNYNHNHNNNNNNQNNLDFSHLDRKPHSHTHLSPTYSHLTPHSRAKQSHIQNKNQKQHKPGKSPIHQTR